MEEVVKKILNLEKIEYKQLKKSTSGFTNFVYFVDNKYVIKVSKDKESTKNLQKECEIYKNLNLFYIPKYISSGRFNKYQYLIMSKINGKSLFSIWHLLKEKERKDIIGQIAKILKEFNCQNCDFLNKSYKHTDWVKYIKSQLRDKKIKLKKMGIKDAVLSEFIKNDIDELFSKNTFGLVYNDAHFDNFLYDGKKVYLIDFDRVVYCPIDYEMLIFKTMCDIPDKFASEEDYMNAKIVDYDFIYPQFKQDYPEMFEVEDVEKRIFIYQFNYLVGQAIETKNVSWAKQLLDVFDDKMNYKY